MTLLTDNQLTTLSKDEILRYSRHLIAGSRHGRVLPAGECSVSEQADWDRRSSCIRPPLSRHLGIVDFDAVDYTKPQRRSSTAL